MVSYNLLNELVQIANKMGLQKKIRSLQMRLRPSAGRGSLPSTFLYGLKLAYRFLAGVVHITAFVGHK
jgi:hypothetical protein